MPEIAPWPGTEPAPRSARDHIEPEQSTVSDLSTGPLAGPTALALRAGTRALPPWWLLPLPGRLPTTGPSTGRLRVT